MKAVSLENRPGYKSPGSHAARPYSSTAAAHRAGSQVPSFVVHSFVHAFVRSLIHSFVKTVITSQLSHWSWRQCPTPIQVRGKTTLADQLHARSSPRAPQSCTVPGSGERMRKGGGKKLAPESPRQAVRVLRRPWRGWGWAQPPSGPGRASSLRCASLERPLVHATGTNIPRMEAWRPKLGGGGLPRERPRGRSPTLVSLQSSVQYGQFRGSEEVFQRRLRWPEPVRQDCG